MRGRELITLLGGGAGVARPFAARAQQKALPAIGFSDSDTCGFGDILVLRMLIRVRRAQS
jgi:hypothetical protein